MPRFYVICRIIISAIYHILYFIQCFQIHFPIWFSKHPIIISVHRWKHWGAKNVSQGFSMITWRSWHSRQFLGYIFYDYYHTVSILEDPGAKMISQMLSFISVLNWWWAYLVHTMTYSSRTWLIDAQTMCYHTKDNFGDRKTF